jgi:hypothetical protein
MGRRFFRILGLTTAAMFIAASLARAQQDRAYPPASLGLPVVPKFEAPEAAPAPTDAPKPEIAVSPNTGMPRLEQFKDGGNIGMAALAFDSGEYMDPRYIVNSQRPDDPGIWEMFRDDTGEQLHRLVRDYENFYLSENLLYVGVAVAIAAPLANTNADQAIRNWYQRGAGQANAANSTAEVFRAFGDYQYAIPVYATLAFGEYLFPECAAVNTLGDFGWRSLRAMAVGAPTFAILEFGLGSARPDNANDSYWHPFRAHDAVSGHAFVGAIPFLTGASMTDNPFLQTLLFAGSFGPAWSRIQTDDHYLSQVLLGWSIAYLSVQSVNLTECQARNMRIVPVDIPKGVGLGVEVKY